MVRFSPWSPATPVVVGAVAGVAVRGTPAPDAGVGAFSVVASACFVARLPAAVASAAARAPPVAAFGVLVGLPTPASVASVATRDAVELAAGTVAVPGVVAFAGAASLAVAAVFVADAAPPGCAVAASTVTPS